MLFAGVGIGCLALIIAVAANVAMDTMTPVKVAFLFCGFALLIPTMVLKDPRAYWLFLLILSVPFDISKWLSDDELTQRLVHVYGSPAGGTVSLEIYATDVVLALMLLPWLARIALRRDTFYFPAIGYLFLLYLGWALFISLINAESLYFSMFELCRQFLYFLTFVYIINNVTTPLQLRSIVWAVLIGFIISAGSVIVYFEEGIGTDKVAFVFLHDQGEERTSHKGVKKDSDPEALTVGGSEHSLGSMGRLGDSVIKRSQGIFRHPAIPASLCGLILPVVLAYFVAARRAVTRILLALLYLWGLAGLVLTFSRAGAIGFVVGNFAFFPVAGWSGLISRKALRYSRIGSVVALALIIPTLLVYFEARPETFYMRFNMFEAAFHGLSEHPVLGVGLNNGTASMKAGRQELKDMGIRMPSMESADSYYLAVLTEIGPFGFLMYFGFFLGIVIIALRAMRDAPPDKKTLLVGMVAGLAALGTQSIADQPTAGHAVNGIAWLYAALFVVIARGVRAEAQPSLASALAAPAALDLRPAAGLAD
jgi:O-Antigen ligase